ncbi:NAD(P)/FAD-dependent oxidoreductase [Streptacidiphilus sp. NEAU-YB345]|uniref:NAD(P)/FAD-dependent oxidoreductase n=1 Tax=Streptacidiphilus fuscans TaxID=2789292 RepID=A0A931FGN9_9ACTN|nr:NAD(P)/FAD-dependent oxidoreductase [Streptacidiphilus fuscans]MBF9069769.1 NAD(P)/FAD-dependent oxidoreductase [Streptacidiphilus fuscans]
MRSTTNPATYDTPDSVRDAYDVVVIGGGAAGLSGALMLGRSRRTVLVVDAGEPRNAPAEGAHALLGLDGIRPTDLLARGRAEVRGYGGHVVAGAVTGVSGHEGSFRVALADGRTVGARRVLAATGLVDELPEVPGLRERWGKDVVHCPYCHGWEVRDQAIGVLWTGPFSVHQALLFRQLSDDVILFTHTGPVPTGEEAEQLAARGVRVVTGTVAAVETAVETAAETATTGSGADGAGRDRLSGVRLADGTVVPRQAVAVATRMVARAEFLAPLGLLPVAHPSGVAEHIPADPTGLTSVPGVWVAGNITDPTAQVSHSVAAGATAGARINADLVAAEARAAVAARASSVAL